MKYDFIVFGGTGLQGRICSRDLLESGHSVLIAGRNPEGIRKLLSEHRKKSKFIKVDLRNFNGIARAIRKSKARVVVNCAELTFNIAIMKACLKSKRSCTDLGGLQEITREQFKLHPNFQKAGIINITGCGSTPGIINVMARHAAKHFDKIETIYLGFAWDSNIKKFVTPYSIQSIFNEFTQNPVTYHNGKFIAESKFRCIGRMKFPEVGEQTVYCIVHSEVFTFSRYFKNKGLKNIHYMAGFPEHSLAIIKMLIDLGFNSKKPIVVEGKKISPLEYTQSILKKLKTPKGYKETEDLWVRIDGFKSEKRKKMKMDCIIRSQKGWEEAGSNIDTGQTISVMSQMLFNGLIKENGVYAPESVIPEKEFFAQLARRKMFIYENGRRIN